MPIQIHEDDGGKLLTVHVSGSLTRTDYERFVPEFEGLFRQHGKLRLLFDLSGFRGLDAAALWEEIKFDVRHLDEIERCAMVGDRRWQRVMTAFSKPFMKAEIKYFDHTDVMGARKWLAQPDASGAGKATITESARDQNAINPIMKSALRNEGETMLKHRIIEPEEIVVLEPHGPLEARDFADLARETDPYIAEHGKLPGMMIHAKSFPGWANPDAFLAHMRFLQSHFQKIVRLAMVSDDTFLADASRIAAHLVHAQVQHFPESDYAGALNWLKAASGVEGLKNKVR
ncbi:MAG: STAS/SEC14 domain-containing protein [Opitutaceae bacterium]